MGTIDLLRAEIKRAGANPGDRNRVLKRISRDYGKGFAEQLVNLVEADAQIRATEDAIARAPYRRRPRPSNRRDA